MKFLFLFLLSLSLSIEVSAQNSYKYVWGDFHGINQTPETNGFVMENVSNITLDSNGHIRLEKNTVAFNFSDTPVRPSLAEYKPFCIGLTFEAGSFSSPGDSLINLFSGQFNSNTVGDSLGMNISYNGKTHGEVSFTPSGGEGQITTKIDPSKDLTVFISHAANDTLTISFHSGTELVTSMQIEAFKINGGDMERFVIGDANSNMVIKGLGVMVGDSMNDNWLEGYFKEVGISQSIPEPGTAILALFGGGFILRRRRAA